MIYDLKHKAATMGLWKSVLPQKSPQKKIYAVVWLAGYDQ